MEKLAATIGIMGILTYPAVGVASSVPCWQVEPKPGSADGWVAWTAPNGTSYGIPHDWDVDRAYAELEAAGLCSVNPEPAQDDREPGQNELASQPPADEVEQALEDYAPDTPAPEDELTPLQRNLAENIPQEGSTGESDGSLLLFLIGPGVFGAWSMRDYQIDPLGQLHKPVQMPIVHADVYRGPARTVTVSARPVPSQPVHAGVAAEGGTYGPSPAPSPPFTAPWDEGSSDSVDHPSPPFTGTGEGFTGEGGEGGEGKTNPYKLDLLKGIDLTQFKKNLDANGFTKENVSFADPDHLDSAWVVNRVGIRMCEFWERYHSRKVDHAVYFTFGMTKTAKGNGPAGNRYAIARDAVEQWFKTHVDGEETELFGV